jgi:lysophospholipid acyltransferase (LPLAT)-like uncharacterized protein
MLAQRAWRTRAAPLRSALARELHHHQTPSLKSQKMPRTPLQRLALTLIPPLAALLIALLGLSLRWDDLPEPDAIVEQPGTSGIFCFWHQCTLLAGWRFRRFHPHVLISQSFDGELIARTLHLLGYRTVRGSSNRRGAVAGLFALRDLVLQGQPVVFTADGPRGPIHQAKPGPVKLAQITGCPLGSFHLHPSSAWTLGSWDRFLIPKPFSRVTVAWARKVPAPAPDASPCELDATRLALNDALERARTLARATH